MIPKVCDNCALGMFNTKCKCLDGVGNPMSGMIIVVPNVDYNVEHYTKVENYVEPTKN